MARFEGEVREYLHREGSITLLWETLDFLFSAPPVQIFILLIEWNLSKFTEDLHILLSRLVEER